MTPIANCDLPPKDYGIKWSLGVPHFVCPDCSKDFYWHSESKSCSKCTAWIEDCLECNFDEGNF